VSQRSRPSEIIFPFFGSESLRVTLGLITRYSTLTMAFPHRLTRPSLSTSFFGVRQLAYNEKKLLNMLIGVT
jgi:hypothetical protein